MAGRPTYHAAVGKAGSSFISRMLSGKDQAAHTTLKSRAVPEMSVFLKERGAGDDEASLAPSSKLAAVLAAEKAVDTAALLHVHPTAVAPVAGKYDDSDALNAVDYDDEDDVRVQGGSSSSSKFQMAGIDEDDENDDDDDDDDDELALHAELEKIKAERAAAQIKRERVEAAARDGAQWEGALRSNPLVDLSVLGGGDAWSAKVRPTCDVFCCTVLVLCGPILTPTHPTLLFTLPPPLNTHRSSAAGMMTSCSATRCAPCRSLSSD